jgi:hypothetical protein
MQEGTFANDGHAAARIGNALPQAHADRPGAHLSCRLLADVYRFILVDTLAVNCVARSRRHGP